MLAGPKQAGFHCELKPNAVRTFKFWLTLAIHEENNRYKLSQVAYNDIKWIKDKALWSQKIKNSLYHIGLGNLWEKAHFSDVEIGT